MYCICTECNAYLSYYHDSNINDEVAWYIFIWELLSNNNINEQYGDAVWVFISSE